MSRVFAPLLVLLIGAFGMAAAQTGPAGGQGGRTPVEVGVIDLRTEEVPRIFTLPGRASAYEDAQIRPRVNGVVAEILYTPGTLMRVGDPMFRLEAESYAAQVASARASLSRAEAAVPVADANVKRHEKLAGTTVTAADLEDARLALVVARADAEVARSNLEMAEIELSRTTIRSPIAGIASIPSVSVGDLVTASQSQILARVTRFDPIYVDMMEPSARILQIREQIDAGLLRTAERPEVRLTLENGAVFSRTGDLVARSESVSASTGTVDLRFRFDNPDRVILPGMFVRGELTLGTMSAILVPQGAATRERDGTLGVWIAGADGKAERRKITTGGTHENAWIVTDGVKEGERLIIDNFRNLRAGTAVEPVAVAIDSSGVVRTLPAGE